MATHTARPSPSMMKMDGFRVLSSIHRKAFVVKRPDHYSTAWPFSKAFGRKWIKLLICGKCHSINICVLMQYSAISVDFSQWVFHFSATAGASGNRCHNSYASQIRAYVFNHSWMISMQNEMNCFHWLSFTLSLTAMKTDKRPWMTWLIVAESLDVKTYISWDLT